MNHRSHPSLPDAPSLKHKNRRHAEPAAFAFSGQIYVEYRSYGFFGVFVAAPSAVFAALVLGVDSTVMLLVTFVAPQRLANCVALPLCPATFVAPVSVASPPLTVTVMPSPLSFELLSLSSMHF